VSDAGILPIKSPAAAKQRLARDLDPGFHAAVVEALYLDALDLCVASPGVTWLVVSDDGTVLQAAASRGLSTLRDAGAGLNPAVQEALSAVRAQGADAALVIPSDVPLARSHDIQDLLDTGATSDVVLVPSGADGGTNGLFMRPTDLLKPSFGPSSLQAHLESVEATGSRCSVLPLARLALDIDTIEDAHRLVKQPASEAMGRTERLLREELAS
jgi:2-phospho-L-lactate guanylyltransferase